MSYWMLGTNWCQNSKGWLKAVGCNVHSVLKQAGLKDLMADFELNKVDRI